MRRSLFRTLPALVVLAMLTLALFAPARVVRAGKSEPAEVDYLYYPTCTNVYLGGAGTGASYDIVGGEGITQPLVSSINIASTIIPQAPSGWTDFQYRVVYWDPANLAPSSGEIQLRSLDYGGTTYPFTYDRVDLFPPVITQALASVAEPPPAQVAIEQHMRAGDTGTRSLTLVANDATTSPAALHILSDGTRTALPGSHPVFQYQLCEGDQALQNLRVVQAVMKSDSLLDPSTTEYVQKFRVPADATVRWIELAFGSNPPVGGYG